MKKKANVTKKVLILRTCASDMTSHRGFRWPESGAVECPDWKPTDNCGNGLHGLLWGCGDGSLLKWEADAKWLVAEVEESDCIDLSGKVKFPRAMVVHCGTQQSATEYILSNGAAGKPVVGAIVNTAGYRGTATAGYRGTATAGDGGTATAGDGGTATAGDGGTATAGYRGTANAGDGGTATAGYRGTANAGYRGTANAGYGGTATAGYGGTANAGDGGTANAGDGGTATAGDGGTATAGDGGTLCIKYWDGKRYRMCIAYVGENGIKPNTKYRVENGAMLEVKGDE